MPPMPSPVPAQTSPLWDSTIDRPLSEEQFKQWQTREQRGYTKAKTYHPQWQRGLDRYAKAMQSAPGTGDDISALLDYRHTEGSKASLFHRTPDVNLIPVDPQDQAVPYDAILPLREKALNHELGPERAHAKRALHKTLIDTITASGYLICEIGFEQVTLPTSTMQPGMFGTPAAPMQIDVPVWSRRFIEAVSSKRLVIPDDFYDTDFDKSPWLGIKGVIPLATAKRLKWNLPADFSGTKTLDAESRYKDGGDTTDASEPQVEYTKIYYKASLYDETVFNPDLYRCLILVNGVDQPVWHRDSPFQTLTPQGALTDDSMIGNPIHVDTIRDLVDSAYVPSDLVIIEKESVELDRFRTTLVRNRRRRQPITLVNDELGDIVVGKMTENAGPVPIPSQYFDGSNASRAVQVTQAATEPRDNYTAQNMIEHDVELAVGRSANQGGQYANKKVSATETKVVQANAGARARVDIDRVRDYFIRLVRKFDVVFQRTATQEELAKILGQQAAGLWEQWRALPGKYAYKIQPDSGRFTDSEEYRAQKVSEYNMFAQDPWMNPVELRKQVATALGYDAAKLVLPQLPPKPSSEAKVSFAISLDTAMMNPQEMELALSLLEQNGYQIPPDLKQAMLLNAQLRQAVAQLPAAQGQGPTGMQTHGGPAEKAPRVDKRSDDRTGGVQGVGRTGVAA